MSKELQRLIASAAQQGAAEALVALGLTAGELSQRAAIKTYGKWLREAMQAGKILPVRIEEGYAGTRWYAVRDILALRTEYAAQALFTNPHTL